jgi:subtilisin family serine protease
MQRVVAALVLLCALASSAASAPAAIPAQVVVLPRPDVPLGPDALGRASTPDARLAGELARLGLEQAEVAGGGRAVAGGPPRVLVLSGPRVAEDPAALAQALVASGRVRAAIPNLRLRLFATVPNDPDVPLQWWLPGGDGVHLTEAWDVTLGDTSVTLGVMDTGVDLGHPDLAAQIWTNPGEIPGNAIDDDGNGYVDDLHGWDFGNGDADPNPHAVIDPIGLDVGFHGTYVSAIASAATHNAEGIAGAGWRCRIVPLKVADTAGEITSASVAAAFQYATAMGIDVLNMSFGGPGDPGVPEFFQALVDDADSAGVVCVAAAGNDGTADLSYPAACDRVLSVGATDDTGARASFSNHGPTVDVAAPGSLMWSALCTNYVIDDTSQIFYILFFGWDGERPYMYGDGTSFAAPLVAGVCGLVRARWPWLTAGQVAGQILASGDSVTYDQPIGVKLNAFRAVSAPPVGVPRGLAHDAPALLARPNPSRAATTLTFSLARPQPVSLEVFDLGGRRVRALAAGRFASGSHAVAWDGRDEAGRPVAAGVYLARLASADGEVRCKVARLR